MSDLGFSYRATKDGQVQISRDGRVVTTLRGSSASSFLKKVEGASDERAQQVMARATGNYKRGNERRGGRSS